MRFSRPSLLSPCCGPSVARWTSLGRHRNCTSQAFLSRRRFSTRRSPAAPWHLIGQPLRAAYRRPRTRPRPSIATSSPGCARTVRASRLIHGEEEERAGVSRSLRRVMRAWSSVAAQTMKTTLVSQTSSYVAPVLPIILCAPKFFDGSMSLGEVMQAASAFTIVQAAFNWLVDNYPKMADWTASARRVASLMVALDDLERAETEAGGIARQHQQQRERSSFAP